jgi:hypothetical protein
MRGFFVLIDFTASGIGWHNLKHTRNVERFENDDKNEGKSQLPTPPFRSGHVVYIVVIFLNLQSSISLGSRV